MNDSATSEAAPPLADPLTLPVERRFYRAQVLPNPNPKHNFEEIEAKLQLIEQEVEKWLGGRASLVLRHVADLRKLL